MEEGSLERIRDTERPLEDVVYFQECCYSPSWNSIGQEI